VANQLVSPVLLSPAFDPTTVPKDRHPPFVKYQGIWDTGATGSVITQKVVSQLKLKPTGMANVHGAHGVRTVNTHLVNIVLPSEVGIPGVRVTEGDLPAPTDVLIGMDIIGQGDFAVTNFKERTVFSFRTPSLEVIDFETKAVPDNLPIPLNGPCPCNSGRKYKSCCGRARRR